MTFGSLVNGPTTVVTTVLRGPALPYKQRTNSGSSELQIQLQRAKHDAGLMLPIVTLTVLDTR
jgi:hypothetical protein